MAFSHIYYIQKFLQKIILNFPHEFRKFFLQWIRKSLKYVKHQGTQIFGNFPSTRMVCSKYRTGPRIKPRTGIALQDWSTIITLFFLRNVRIVIFRIRLNDFIKSVGTRPGFIIKIAVTVIIHSTILSIWIVNLGRN